MTNELNDGLFHRVEDASAITRCKGVFRQVDVYTRNHRIFVKHGNGFIGLSRTGTTHPDVYIDGLTGITFKYDRLGRMVTLTEEG